MLVIPVILQTVLPFAQKQQFIREAGFKTISEIDIDYRQSELSQEDPQSQFPKHAPKPGDRVPYLPVNDHSIGTQDLVKGTQFHFVLFSGEETHEKAQQILQKLNEEHPDLIEFDEIRLSTDTKELYEKFGIKKHGYYFVRPDSHIAYRSTSLDTQNFSTYLERFLVK